MSSSRDIEAPSPHGETGPATERDGAFRGAAQRLDLWRRGLVPDPDPRPTTVPDRIGIDAAGFGWRAWNDVGHLSTVPQNPDNEPIPSPVTWFVPEDQSAVALLGEVVDWFGVPDWSGPSLPEHLARRIARCLTGNRPEGVAQ